MIVNNYISTALLFASQREVIIIKFNDTYNDNYQGDK